MPSNTLSDSDAKALLRSWPGVTKKWSPQANSGVWLRAQPGPDPRPNYRTPFLSIPGADLFTTQPDGLWVSYPGKGYCDIIAIEVCGTIQNFNDKRSRYVHTSYSLLLNCDLRWLKSEVPWKRGSSFRWKLAKLRAPKGDAGKAKSPKYRVFPVRYVSVLYALPNQRYAEW